MYNIYTIAHIWQGQHTVLKAGKLDEAQKGILGKLDEAQKGMLTLPHVGDGDDAKEEVLLVAD